MLNGIIPIPSPVNEPVRMYAPGSPEKASLKARLAAMLGETPGKPEELATLSKLQLGNVEDPDEREALAAISPANLISAYASPVVLFHNKDDVTADHSQSETFYRKMLAADKEITFFSGQGSHGFTPEEEAAAYRLIAGKFHEWQNASATPHLP